MSVNGIWKVEMLGPYGWETISTTFLEDGKYKGASQDNYTVGNYEISGNRIEMSAKTMAHGNSRTMFGKKKKQMGLEIKGEIDGDKIRGQAQDDKGSYQITFRATRLEELT